MANKKTLSTRQDVKYRLQATIIRGLLWLLRVIPFSPRRRFGGWFFGKIVAPLAGYNKRVVENLARVWPEVTPDKADQLAKDVCRNVGITLTELFSPNEFSRHVIGMPISGPGLDLLKQAQSEGRPTIVVSGHFGNYDAVRANLIHAGLSVGGLYRRMNNPYFHKDYIESISKIGTPLFERGRPGLKEMVTFLRSGGSLAVLIDQHAWNGAPVTFFGETAYTALSVAELALKFNAVMVPAYAIRQADLSYEIVLEEPIEHSDAVQMTQDLNDSLEKRVRVNPEQWFWIHRRWKKMPAHHNNS